jgi:FkbM family methyltransferase
MFTQRSRHLLLQTIFWNPIGSRVVPRIARLGAMFDTVVRGYSLIPTTNGERWLLTLMDDCPVVIDVGFHDGATTAELLSRRPNARVLAFDPSRFASEKYEAMFRDDARVSFAPVALSKARGEVDFYDYENMCNSLAARKDDLSATPTIYKVSVTTLDDYCEQHEIANVNLMKIDAEGYDLDVLEGARKLLERQGVDIFMFEFASGWAATKRYLWEAVEYLDPLPYRIFQLYNGFLKPLKYTIRVDSCTTLSAMYVGVSEQRFARGDIPVRDYAF